MPTLSPRPLLICAAAAAALAVAAPTASAASRVRQCDGVVRHVLQRSSAPEVLNAVTKISTRGMTCNRAESTVASMMLQVGASSPTLSPTQNPRYWFADDSDFWRKTAWTIAHTSGDPRGKTGARWHITKGKTSLRFTRWM